MKKENVSGMLKVFLFVIASLVTSCRGQPVSLTVEGEVSLVGELCPGTVRLFCEALDLTSLRLSYDENLEIVNFFPNSQPSFEANLGNPAFVSVNLTKVVRQPGSPVADYFLYITVDLFQLQAQNIESISCGNVDAVDTVLVNVTIEPERIPNAPSIMTVNVTYESGVLTLLDVTWDKTKDICSAYTSSLGYTVTLDDGQNSTQKVVNYNISCTEDACRASFTNVMLSSGTYMITVQAFNSLGFSDNDFFEIDNIQSQGNVSNTSTTDCQIFGYCNTACIVRYTTDSNYRNFIESITANNTEFYSPELFPNTTYFVEIMYFNNNGLFSTNQVQIYVYCISAVDKGGVHPAAIAVPIVIFVAIIALITILAIIFWFFYKLRKRSYEPNIQSCVVEEKLTHINAHRSHPGKTSHVVEKFDDIDHSSDHGETSHVGEKLDDIDHKSDHGETSHVVVELVDNVAYGSVSEPQPIPPQPSDESNALPPESSEFKSDASNENDAASTSKKRNWTQQFDFMY